MRLRRVLMVAMAALMVSGCIKEVKDIHEDILAQPRKYPNDSSSRVLNEMKRPPDKVVPVAAVVDDRNARIAALERELAGLRAERDRLASRVSDLESELARLRADRDRLAARVTDLENQLAQLRAERDRLSARVKELEDQLGQGQGQLDQLKAERDRLAARVKELEDELAKCRQERDALAAQVAGLQQRVRDLEGQLAQLDQLKAERDRLAAALASAQAALAAANQDKNRLQGELDECRGKLRQCEADLDALRKQVAELEARPPKVIEKIVEKPVPVEVVKEKVVEKVVTVPVIELRADALFDTAKAELRPNAEKALHNAAEALKKLASNVKAIKVDGHADSRRIRSKEFPSNKELSEARAQAVANYLIEHSGIPADKFIVTGHGDTEPVADNKTKEGQAQNRRVTVTVDQAQ